MGAEIKDNISKCYFIFQKRNESDKDRSLRCITWLYRVSHLTEFILVALESKLLISLLRCSN